MEGALAFYAPSISTHHLKAMIELTNIHKAFGTVQALDGVNLKAEAGTIHGIVGENGAGKSTLMKVLTGFTARSGGEIFFKGQKARLDSPKDALRLGIGMLYQEPLDFPQLRVLDNFMAGRTTFAPTAARAELARLAATFGFSLNPADRVEYLTVGERQQLELLRLIGDGATVLILDEPTTGISEVQQELLFAALRKLKAEGATIFLVSHKLGEIDQLCDTVTVLRHGRVAATRQRPFDRDTLLRAMFDDLPKLRSPPECKRDRMPILEFDRVVGRGGRTQLQDVSITICAGEVVGLAGIDGSGQSAFLRTACGLVPHESGQVLRFGKPLRAADKMAGRTTVFLPADRLSEGLFPGMTVREHHLLATPGGALIASTTGLTASRQAIAAHSIKGLPQTMAEDLSGGNQQRLLLSLIPSEARLILMENPTRGLDVQSAAWTWHHLHSRMKTDGAIIFASPDLEEIMSQASRIVVFYNGRIVLDTPTRATNYHTLSRAITGQVETVNFC
ncbi:MAG: sugar ABC transporter ATP-binding protein [Proteobacteria bacterium]|nr:sugar ABC transporter ATP-binding protein [Pseudomonadota bacterium]